MVARSYGRAESMRSWLYLCYHRGMTIRKQRLTVTVDPQWIEVGNRAVISGAADSLSGWVNAALAEKVRRDQQLEHLHAAIADYESEFGVIADDEVAAQRRSDRHDALVVPGRMHGAPDPARASGEAKSG